MLAKLGKKTAFLGMVGQDSFGTLLRDVLQEVGIETKGLKVSKDINTTLAFVHTKPDGDREFSFYRNPGADIASTLQGAPPGLTSIRRLPWPLVPFSVKSISNSPNAAASYFFILAFRCSIVYWSVTSRGFSFMDMPI